MWCHLKSMNTDLPASEQSANVELSALNLLDSVTSILGGPNERSTEHLVSTSAQLHDGARSECWSQFENPLAAHRGVSAVRTLRFQTEILQGVLEPWLQELSQEIIEARWCVCRVVRTLPSTMRCGKSQQSCRALAPTQKEPLGKGWACC